MARACGVAVLAGALLGGASCSAPRPVQAPRVVTNDRQPVGGRRLHPVAPPAASGRPRAASGLGTRVSSSGTHAPEHPTGRCPPIADQVKRIFSHAAGLEHGERAMAEAARMRLDALYQTGCYRNLDQAQLGAQFAELVPPNQSPQPGEPMPHLDVEFDSGNHNSIVVGYPGFAEATNSWIGLYGWKHGKVRTRILVYGTGKGMKTQLFYLNYASFQPSGAPQPLLVIANTFPWTASCWRRVRFRVLAPSGDPFHPQTLLDHRDDAYWCDGVRLSIQGDVVHFDYQGWGLLWDTGGAWRPLRLTYQYQRSSLRQRFGFVPSGNFVYFIEDWLYQPWSLAEQATVAGDRGRLETVHARLSARVERLKALEVAMTRAPAGKAEQYIADYSSEIFPVSTTERRVVLYCVMRATRKPCADWPKPVQFIIQHDGGVWLVKDVKGA